MRFFVGKNLEFTQKDRTFAPHLRNNAVIKRK